MLYFDTRHDGHSIKKSIIIGLIVFAIGLFLCSCEVNPVSSNGTSMSTVEAEMKTLENVTESPNNTSAGVESTEQHTTESDNDEQSTETNEKPLIATSGTTSSGTPIIDQEGSAFSLSNVEMKDTPDSSCFSMVGYNSEYEILVLTFRDSGGTYLYTEVPRSVWDDFSRADSLGGYYNETIKGTYNCYKY